MKRVYLWQPGTPETHLPTVRAAAVALARFAVDGKHGRKTGDVIHDWITEGRRAQYERALARGDAWAVKLSKTGGYSSCGDLLHWLYTMLGVRDELVINRTDDGGVKDWVPGPNISRLVGSKFYVRAGEGTPEDGDGLHVANTAFDHHVAVLLERVSDDQWLSADYGQPHGQRRVCQLRDTYVGRIVRGRVLEGWVSLAKMVEAGAFTESAIVPDDFVGGVPDDNPYDEDLRIPAAA